MQHCVGKNHGARDAHLGHGATGQLLLAERLFVLEQRYELRRRKLDSALLVQRGNMT